MVERHGSRSNRAGRIFDDVVSDRMSRRAALKGAVGASLVSFLGGDAVIRGAAARSPSALLGFSSIAISRADTGTVPPGCSWRAVAAWGEPIVAGGPEFSHDATQSAADHAMQAGMHHDGMHFFPLPRGSNSSGRGLLAVNFEYADGGLMHRD